MKKNIFDNSKCKMVVDKSEIVEIIRKVFHDAIDERDNDFGKKSNVGKNLDNRPPENQEQS